MIYYQDIFIYMLNRHLPLLPIYMYCLIIGKINKPPCYNVIINNRTISYPIVNLLHYIIYGTSLYRDLYTIYRWFTVLKNGGSFHGY